MVTVIDFDGTLALGDTKNISKMIPNLKLVSLINSLYEDGNTIKIVTARGCKSCNTFEERYNKYFEIIDKWLKKYNIKYHELSFYKEYADVYIDDRAINIKDTIYYNKLDSKFTNNKVRRVNNFVVKKSDTSTNEVKWYDLASKLNVNIPEVLSYDNDTITTKFVDGKSCNNIDLFLDVLNKFKVTPPSSKVGFGTYIERIELHLQNNPTIIGREKLIKLLYKVNIPNTFNHGDFSTTNLIESNGELYLIDPIMKDDIFQSYVLDTAKHLYSILYYDLNYDLYNQCYSKYTTNLEVDSKTLDILIACESIRVANRKPQLIDLCNNLIDIL
jgi:tRNA A-37 threonylcarbamoyl transferase component Bud32|tara:strand:+ start:9169 stop:10158 length:990 start_codon:yes stop_codon:yes gene_type:complete